MKIRYAGAPEGTFKIKVPPKNELVFVDKVCEVEEIFGRRLLVAHPEYEQIVEPEIKEEIKESVITAPEIPKAKVGRPAKKIEEIPIGEDQQAIKDFVKQI